MSQVAEGLYAIYRGLPPREREVFLTKLLADRAVREDMVDALVIVARRRQKGRPLEAVVRDLRAAGRLK